MRKKVVILILINIVVITIICIIQSLCVPCPPEVKCPPCISREQIILIILLCIFDLFFIGRMILTKKSNVPH